MSPRDICIAVQCLLVASKLIVWTRRIRKRQAVRQFVAWTTSSLGAVVALIFPLLVETKKQTAPLAWLAWAPVVPISDSTKHISSLVVATSDLLISLLLMWLAFATRRYAICKSVLAAGQPPSIDEYERQLSANAIHETAFATRGDLATLEKSGYQPLFRRAIPQRS